MKFEPALQKARFLQRYKRFLVDVELACGTVVTAHCPNTGSMRHCFEDGGTVWISANDNPARKLRFTWELSRCRGHMIGVNTGCANRLVKEAIANGLMAGAGVSAVVRSEVQVAGSRIDFLADGTDGQTFVEVKSVTLCESEGQGLFPDAITTRGTRHLDALRVICESGGKALLVFCVQHSGIKRVTPAYHIDPVYGRAFDAAVAAGVNVVALGAHLSAEEIYLHTQLAVDISGRAY